VQGFRIHKRVSVRVTVTSYLPSRVEVHTTLSCIDDSMALAENTPNLMQRLARLPTSPHVGRCSAESLFSFPSAINTTFRKKHSYEMVLQRPVEPAHLIGKFNRDVRKPSFARTTHHARNQVNGSRVLQQLPG
jgi:hypothetical protein